MKKINHLKEIFSNYENFIIDLWGVVHNGIKAYPGALKVIEELHNNNKNYTFLSNAPRPVKDVRDFLINKIKIDNKYLKNIFTSGEAAILSIKELKYGKFFFHLGPDRDATIFNGLEEYKTNLNKCEYILCTGLYDDFMEDLKYYENLLSKHTAKIMICTNPDLIVDRGTTQEFCAGTIAKIFENIGGKTIYFGKPHKSIYELIQKKKGNTLIIGDNLRTDIMGANVINQDSLFILNGVHKKEIRDDENVQELLNKYKVKTNFFQNELNW